MKAMLAIPLFCLALNAAAECPVQHPRVQPEIPSAVVATPQEMRQAQIQAEQYLSQGKTYLTCGYMNRRQYNQLVSEMEIFAADFNTELLEYQRGAQMVADVEWVQTLPVSGLSAR